jgi:hypothetical protein
MRPFARRVARNADASRCRASAIYRVKPRAGRLQSVRRARYRDRLRRNFVEKKVTHHRVTQGPVIPKKTEAEIVRRYRVEAARKQLKGISMVPWRFHVSSLADALCVPSV